jgi:hypothetical protein
MEAKIHKLSHGLSLFLCWLLFFSCINIGKSYSQERVGILSESLEDTMIRKYQSVYTRPYSFWENDIEFKLAKAQVWTVLGASLAGLGILYLMPESFTNWDKDDSSDIFKKWRKNVKEGPVRDEDDWFLNWITHPYWGAVYYMSARSAGANAPVSFLYSAFVSTFFWEYGIEAFAEVPSIQDLIITPVVGSIIGEGFYLSKRHILSNDYHLLNSTILGHTAIFLMDPVSEVASWFIKDKKKIENKDVSLYSFPSITRNGDIGYNIPVSIRF